MAVQEPENVTGATIFFLYIIAALLLTILLSRDGLKAFASRSNFTNKRQKSQIRPAGGPGLELGISLFAALATLSFAVLSYHMLDFLVQSYQSWRFLAEDTFSSQGSQVHSSTTYHNDSILEKIPRVQIWNWATQSNLFQKFGEVICNDTHRFWWTQLALIYSCSWNIYMKIQGGCLYTPRNEVWHVNVVFFCPGTRQEIAHLWAYFLLGQILPISFTQNLFLLASILHPGDPGSPRQSKERSINIKPVRTYLQLAVSFAYLGTLAAAPASVGTSWFFPLLFTTRFLLFAPYLILRPSSPLGKGQGQRGRAVCPRSDCLRTLLTPIVVVGAVLQVVQTSRTNNFLAILEALNDNPAVSTLGYDFIIAASSIGLFFGLT